MLHSVRFFVPAVVLGLLIGSMHAADKKEKVAFIDSTGLGKLVAIKRDMAGRGKLFFCGVNLSVMRAFELTRLNQVFPIRENVDSALLAIDES